MAKSFEEALMDLETEYREKGTDLGEIISIMELRLYALRDEEAEIAGEDEGGEGED